VGGASAKKPDLSFVIGEIPSELSLDRYWELMEEGKLRDVVLEAERLAVDGRLGGSFWIEPAIAAIELGMEAEASKCLERSVVRVRDW
jgi:hypothetical protein